MRQRFPSHSGEMIRKPQHSLLYWFMIGSPDANVEIWVFIVLVHSFAHVQ